MKKEPLHLKALWLRDYDLDSMKDKIKLALMEDLEPKDHMFHAEDVKSAVEWLEEQYKNIEWQDASKGDFLELLDKAFPDLLTTHKEGK